jgi:hypothetical protein
VLSAPTRQSYERWLDGAVVRGLFSRVPILVEGPGDRAAFAVFWSALARAEPADRMLASWIEEGCAREVEIRMADDGAQA